MGSFWNSHRLESRTVRFFERSLERASQALHPLRRVPDGALQPLIPDTCNLGVMGRIVFAIGLIASFSAVFLFDSGEHVRSAFAQGWLPNLVAAAVSLLLLCGLRSRIVGRPEPVQWMAGIGIPVYCMMLATLVHRLLVRVDIPLGDPWLTSSAAQALAFAVLGHAAGAAIFSVCLLHYFRLRTRAFAPSLSEARLTALQARIRPHFLFNSLNTVLGLLRANPRQAESTLQDLAELFRVFMRDTRELVPLAAELETCRQYLAIETLRLAPRLEVRWALGTVAMDALVPSLLLQPLVENAVHHGIEPSAQAGVIEIGGEQRGDRIWIEITNPLPASGQSSGRMGNQMALSNVRERLMLLFDMEADLQMQVHRDRFQLTLEFPYRPERRDRHD